MLKVIRSIYKNFFIFFIIFLLYDLGIYDTMKHTRREGIRYEKIGYYIRWIAGIARIC